MLSRELFSEIYSVYWLTMAEIIKEAIEGRLDERLIHDIVKRNAFSESVLTILPALKSQDWKLIDKSFKTPIKQPPHFPVTELEKRWLKTISTDPRIKLFSPDLSGLEDVKPLFSFGDIVYFDRYKDGDPFDDQKYINHFRTILFALKNNRRLHIKFLGGKGGNVSGKYIPYRLEYSQKDDKFRLITSGGRSSITINLARITKCELAGSFSPDAVIPPIRQTRELITELYDERNALERVMLHFSGFRKETERVGENTYRLKLWYDRDDETEILIRVLSFGPMLKVLSPDRFIKQIKLRINKQKIYSE